jgi:hypothetical protein
MTDNAAAAVADELRHMRDARQELGSAQSYLSTEEAVNLCPLDISEETLVGYPVWICPRARKNPRRPRSSYQWDPRDIRALPIVLKQWTQAREAGREDDFRRRRETLLEERDQQVLARAVGEVR